MNRHAVILALLIVAGCGPSRKAVLEGRVEELGGEVAQLTEQLEDAQTAAADVRAQAEEVTTASESLQTEVSRFGNENWRDVVPDVSRLSGEVDTSQSDLATAVDDLDSAIE